MAEHGHWIAPKRGNVQHALRRQEAGFQERPGAGGGVGIVGRIAPAHLQKRGIGKVVLHGPRTRWHVAPTDGNAGMPSVLDEIDGDR